MRSGRGEGVRTARSRIVIPGSVPNRFTSALCARVSAPAFELLGSPEVAGQEHRWRNPFREMVKGQSAQLRDQLLLPRIECPSVGRFDFCHRDKLPVDPVVPGAFGDVRILWKHAQLFGRNGMDVFARTAHQIHFAVEDRARIAFEMHIHEAVRRLPDVLPIRMTAHAHQAVHHIARPEQTIDAFQAVDDPFVGVQRENRVVVAVHEQQRPGRDQRRDPRPGPLKGVVKKHAVTVAVDDPIRHIGEQVGHAADRRRGFHPFIRRRDPKRGRPAAADPGHADPLRVHLGTTGQTPAGV